MTAVLPSVGASEQVPTMLKSPDDTKGWTPTRVAGREAWTDEAGVTWVRARPDETPEIVVTFTRTKELNPLPLVRADVSLDVRRAQRKVRRERRALRARGYDA